MNKQQYIQSRNNNQINMELAWEMYINTEHSTPKVPQQIFYQIFPYWLQMVGNVEYYLSYYDQKFEVMKLIGLQGEITYL